MGCIHSKNESSDLHPNVFRVVNIDENGADLCSGQLEITESDIILYREGRDSTIWPLHSLRRYGFEGDIFSFESGRRCETGEGIYAFRCRRASLLFRTLQQQIQLRNVIHDSVTYPVSRLTPSPQGRQTLQASVVHRSSIDNGQPVNVHPVLNNNIANILAQGVNNTSQSPRSPSSVDILEVMPLYPRNETASNHVTNVYQLREFKREHNNNHHAEPATERRHVYTNDLNRDLAMLRNTLRQESELNTIRDIEDETRFLESRYINEHVSGNQANTHLSPTLSNSSEHYAQLSLEQEERSRLYVNIVPNETEVSQTDAIPTTPSTPKQVEYCNINMGNKSIENFSYANLSMGENGDKFKQITSSTACLELKQKCSESDTYASMSPTEETELSYAVLDIDSNKEIIMSKKENIAKKDFTSDNQLQNNNLVDNSAPCPKQPRRRIVSQCSVEKIGAVTTSLSTPPAAPLAVGYTTIDFDKTVALTSVAAGGDIELDGPRKTRHNSSNVNGGSPNSPEKGKFNS